MAAPTPKYTVEELEQMIEKYFLSNPDKPTVTGLAYFLGFESRQSLYDYKNREESSYSIKKAVLRIESKHEEKLYESAAAGSIFWLKNRDWTDKTVHDMQSSDGSMSPPKTLAELYDEERQSPDS